jgi:hypothetical protein
MENLLYEPEGPHNGYTLFLRTENVRVWNAYIDLTGNLTRAGYRVYLESSWGHHRGSRIFYGHPDCLSVLKEVRKIIGQHLSFEEMQVDSLLQLDRSYGLKEIIIQAEKSVLFSD